MNFTAGNVIENWVESIYTHRAYSIDNITAAVGRYGVTPQNINNRRSYFSVAASATKFVAVGEGGYIERWDSSYTALTNYWVTYSSGLNTDLYGVVYSPGLDMFVAVGENGYKSTSASGFTDLAGTTWTAQYTPGNTLRGICWSSTWNKFIAVGDRGTILLSTNGTTWTTPTNPVPTVKNFNAVCAHGNLIVAVGDDWMVYSSVDGGNNWTNRTPYTGFGKLISVAASATNIILLVELYWGTVLTTNTSFSAWTITYSVPGIDYYPKSVKYIDSTNTAFKTFVIAGWNGSQTKAGYVTNEGFINTSWASLSGYTASNSKMANDIACNVTGTTQYLATVGNPVQLYSVTDGTGASISETNNYDAIFDIGTASSTIFCSWRHDYFSIRGEYTGTITLPQIDPVWVSGGKKSNGYHTLQTGNQEYVLCTHNEGYIPTYLVFDTTNGIVLGTNAIDVTTSSTIRQYAIYATTTQVLLNVNYTLYNSTLPQKVFNYRVLVMDQGVNTTSYLNTQPEGLKITPDRIIFGKGKIDTNRNYIVKGASGNLLTTTPHINISQGAGGNDPDYGGIWIYRNNVLIQTIGDTTINNAGGNWLFNQDSSRFSGLTTFIKRSFD